MAKITAITYVALLIVDRVVGILLNSTILDVPHRVRSGRGGIFNIPGPPQG